VGVGSTVEHGDAEEEVSVGAIGTTADQNPKDEPVGEPDEFAH
jgi:hypothetical protein